MYGAATPITKVRVWKGANKEIPLGLASDLYVTAPAGQFKNIKPTIELNEPIRAPIIKGQPYGTINVTFNNQVLASAPLVALENNAKGSLWRRISDSLNFSYYKLFSRTSAKANNG
jgi:D-alanyl-D-alanine carboxypeptidase (penicillin-binding protein 5/6)